jgi:predicted nucleic acid-binding Zn ribbon protein
MSTSPPRRNDPPAGSSPRPRRDARGRSTDGPVRLDVALGAVSEGLGMGSARVVGTVFTRWEELVGAAMAAHVRPLRIDGTTLVCSADHQAWATQARHLGAQILERLRAETEDAHHLERLEVRVRR